ncbi:hypothetical protein, partial [Streptomyces sp. H27-D2]|uniref:hypothetical protein n=1 Tax=Streptomyces sp. H27-D2 TaxID=3046304 RepID=UPI002DB72AA8
AGEGDPVGITARPVGGLVHEVAQGVVHEEEGEDLLLGTPGMLGAQDQARSTEVGQLQIFRGGHWKNQGGGVTSHNKGSGSGGRVMIHVNDSSTKRIGNRRYRTQGKHFGQHGNVWQLPTYYSPTRMLWRRG